MIIVVAPPRPVECLQKKTEGFTHACGFLDSKVTQTTIDLIVTKILIVLQVQVVLITILALILTKMHRRSISPLPVVALGERSYFFLFCAPLDYILTGTYLLH